VGNVVLTMPPAGSDMAALVFKDPNRRNCLDTADPHREREVEQALIDHIQRFLLEEKTRYAFKKNRRTAVTDLYESSS
jgi:predicted nuclease of restriction endonuclease-like (RecB) superfamily